MLEGKDYMLFFETFEQLTCEGEMKKLYEDTEVVRVLASRENKNIYICFQSSHLISRNHIKKMEELLNRQLFLHTANKAILKPRYMLSAQYTLENLYPIYRDSIIEEMMEKSIVAYHIFTRAEIVIDDMKMLVKVADGCVIQNKTPKLKDFLETIFLERFGYTVQVSFEYLEPKEKKPTKVRGMGGQANQTEQGDNGTPKGNDGSPYREHSEEFAATEEGSSEHYSSDRERTGPDMIIRDGDGNPGATSLKSGSEPSAMNAGKSTSSTGSSAYNAGNSAGNAGKSTSSTGSSAYNAGKSAAGGVAGGKGRAAYDRGKGSYRKLPTDISVVYGKNFEGNTMAISDILAEIGEVIIRGKLMKYESRSIGNEKSLITFVLTDYTDSIKIKLYAKTIEVDEITSSLKEGSYYILKGIAKMDTYEHDITIGSVVGIKTISDFTSTRADKAPVKRVELHAHTMMSDMDAVVDVKKLVKRAFSWGHSAIAVTDHGVVQAFPDASHAINPRDYSDEEEQKRAKDFKVIYGVEAYLVDDLKEVVTNGRGQSLRDSFVVFDIETTGFSPNKNKIIEIGAVKLINGEVVDRYSTFINPEVPIPYEIEQLTGIRDEMVLGAPRIDKVLPEFLAFCEGCSLVAHNASFDVSFIKKNANLQGITIDYTVVDTVGLSRILLPELSRYKLNTVAKALGVSLENHHRAVDDAGATAEIFQKLVIMLEGKEINNVNEIEKLGRLSAEAVRKLPAHHAILLAQNDIGRVNLYKMVSLSHIEYFNKRPKIPKSLLMECREGIIVGSACEAGEVYRAVMGNQSQEHIARLVKFYDYLEIQPLMNNEFLIRSDRSDD
ncbi:MAG TPA: exonuclease domain-containing protein, partial [Mobilitalea sp.]|nr:exonuclease domain-containing protein [Mobilitalea sp.]